MENPDSALLRRYLELDAGRGRNDLGIADLSMDERLELAALIRRLKAGMPPVEPAPAFRHALAKRLRNSYPPVPLTQVPSWPWRTMQLPRISSLGTDERVIPIASWQHRTIDQPDVQPLPQHRNRFELLLGAAVIAGIAWWVHNHPESVSALRLPQLTLPHRSAA